MNNLYSFRCRSTEAPNGASTLVIFSGPGDFDISDLTAAVSDNTKNDLSPELVVLLYPAGLKEHLDELGQDEIQTTFAAILYDVPIGAYIYDRMGGVTLARSLRGHAPAQIDLAPIQRQGLSTLFIRRGALLEAGPTAHFVKPSGRHDRRFLRAAHALSEGAEIFFCAFWILKYLDDDVKRIHVDTSAIASIVLAGLLMRATKAVPLITTFKSYDGMKHHPFNKDRKELVLISASQSGEMAKNIAKHIADPKLVVTLFSIAPVQDSHTTILANLCFDKDLNPSGVSALENKINEANSRPIKLIGEHFLAAPGAPRLILPRVTDRPEAIKNSLPQLVGKGVFRVFTSSLIAKTRRAIWIDVPKLIETAAFKKWATSQVAMHIPATIRAIVHFDNDPSSLVLAEAIKGEVERQGGHLQTCQILSLKTIESADPDASIGRSPVLVVGGATGHGGEFLMASRALRRYAPQSHRIYLTTAVMPVSYGAAAALRKNLEQPSHRFHWLFEMFVNRERLAESWDAEYQLLADDDELPPELEARLGALERSDGLIDDLFLPARVAKLQLRDNFAFWPSSVDCLSASQADVFTTIAAILENIRSGEKTPQNERLINDAYNRCIIAAEAFFRFNDGIIQAAMIRASLPIELDYSDSPGESELMADLIGRMIDLQHRSHGEALSEFLLALALERMKLSVASCGRLKTKIDNEKASLSETNQWLAAKIPWPAKA